MFTKKSFILVSLVGSFVATSQSAFAQEAPRGTLLAPAPQAPEKAAPVGDAGDPDANKTGWAIKVEIPLVVPAGKIGGTADETGPGIGAGAAIGYYVTPHIGLFAGAQLSVGHSWSACPQCSGIAFEAPVYLEIAQSRAHGFYGTAGLALFATQSMSDSSGDSISVTTPFDLKFGLGYRLSQRDLFTQTGPSKVAFTIFANGTLGQFQSITENLGNDSASGDIPEKQFHYTLQAGIGGSFFL